MNILLLCDLRHWVLGRIAESLSAQLNAKSKFLRVHWEEYPKDPYLFYRLTRKYDVVHMLMHYENSMKFPLAKPLVSTFHHHQEDSIERLMPWVGSIHAFCVPNQHEMLWLNAHEALVTKKPVFLTPYGLELDEFQPNDDSKIDFLRDRELPQDVILFGFSGKRSSNSHDRKGLDRLWLLVRRLQDSLSSEFRLVFFGPTHRDSPLHGWSYSDVPCDIRNLVLFMGESIAPPDYSFLDYYLCLSRFEGGPYPVMECMAQKVVVFATRVGTCPEIIAHGENGFLVNPKNYLDMIPKEVETLESDSARKIGIGTRARHTIISARYWDVVVDPIIYECLYEEAMKRYQLCPLPERLWRHISSFSCRHSNSWFYRIMAMWIRIMRYVYNRIFCK